MRLSGKFLLLLFFYGCSKEKLKAPDAFYLKPNSVSVSTSTAEGTSSSKITDLWLYVNGNFKGVYPTGNILPIVSYGPTNITIFPGIKNNGISTTRAPYVFYDLIPIDTAVNTGITVNRNFNFKYKSSTKFHVIETFIGGTNGISLKKSANSDTNFTVIQSGPDLFEGSVFFFGLDDNRRTGQFQSTTFSYALPAFGASVYMELNFKCDQPFDVGVYNGSDFRYAATCNKSEEWNKIYVNLTPAVSTNPYPTVGFYIKAVKDPNVSNPKFFIDNIKILSF